ncbi:unnamed protein product [Porites evermanni]|uniref:Uncharacterized protein n=1 Tax=Porites evermanni TaxID=104178 RepID=A0ABN8MHQ9_9CNID|nr:unnamed protein product [Porites evermanni]
MTDGALRSVRRASFCFCLFLQTNYKQTWHPGFRAGNWTKWEFDADSFEEAMTEVKKLETHMYNIPNFVNRMPHTKLFALRIVVTPNVGDVFKAAVYLELEKMLNELQVMSVASSKCRIDFKSNGH